MRRMARLRHPQTTVRWRLTLLYGGLFLVCGTALLTVTYVLVAHANVSPNQVTFRGPPFVVHVKVPPNRPLPPGFRTFLRSKSGAEVVGIVGADQRVADLHQLILESGIALAIMALIAAALGWVVAGRVLRPLRTMTVTAQEISEASLHRRLAMAGPRDELRELADTIDALLGRLENAFEAQRRFVSNASHELRTPLTAMRAMLELALDDPHASVATFRATCRHVLEEGEQQEQLIDALLALAQGQRGIDQREPVDLAAIAGDALGRCQAQFDAERLRVETSLEAATVSGDRRLLDLLVSNLVENAVRHNLSGGELKLRVWQDGGAARLEISNTGPPVPDTAIERLLLPFQRLGQERVGARDGLGLGLGLSIVAAIASAHGGILELRPRAEGGLTVDLQFPAVEGAASVPSMVGA